MKVIEQHLSLEAERSGRSKIDARFKSRVEKAVRACHGINVLMLKCGSALEFEYASRVCHSELEEGNTKSAVRPEDLLS